MSWGLHFKWPVELNRAGRVSACLLFRQQASIDKINVFSLATNFSSPETLSTRCCGWLYGCGTAQLRANVLFLAALVGWAGFTTLLTGSALKRLRVLRIRCVRLQSFVLVEA